jgi:hypothetical protein
VKTLKNENFLHTNPKINFGKFFRSWTDKYKYFLKESEWKVVIWRTGLCSIGMGNMDSCCEYWREREREREREIERKREGN